MFTLDNLNQTLQQAKDTIEDVIKGITSKNDITPTQLEHLSKAVCIVEKLKSIERQENDFSENSYRRGRSRTTGQYVSRNGSSSQYYDNSGRHYRDGDSSRRYNDSSGYSGHSIKDRMISRLEEMFDEAQSEHEKQIVQEWIDRLTYNR